MASRLSNILQQEYKTKGLVGGAAAALGKRSLEKLDIRNALFGGSGVGSIIGTKIFGKGYSATKRSGTEGTTSPSNQMLSSGSSPLLQEININSKITAKNSMALPSMAKQMNIMQKNIAKLVKIWGGTPTTKADSFFSSAKFRENQYESQFNKGTGTRPTKVEEKEKSSGGFLGMLSSLASGIMSVIGSVVSVVIKSIKSLSGILTGIGLAASGLGAAFVRILGFLASTKIGKILGITAALAVGAYKFLGGSPQLNEGDVETQPGGFYGDQPPESPGIDSVKGVGASAAVLGAGLIGRKLTSKLPSSPSSVPSTSASGGKPLSDFGSVGKNREMEKNKTFLQKIVDVIMKASKQGQITSMLTKLSKTFGYKIAAKIGSVIAGIIASPAGGVSLLLSVIGFAMLASDMVALYEWFVEYEKELDAYKKTLSPTATSDTSSPNQISSPSEQSSNSDTTPSNVTTNSSQTTGFDYKSLNKNQSEMASLIHRKFIQAGFTDAQATAAVVNAYAESKLNPKAESPETSKEKSYGLFQMNTKGGLGTGHTPENLKDPNYNIDLMIKEAMSKRGNNFRNATSIESAVTAFTKDLERPANADAEAAKRVTLASSLTGTGTKIDGSVLASASAAKESAASQSMFTPADMADILAVLNPGKTSGGQSGMNEVVSASKATPYDKDFYSNLVRTIAL